MRQIPLAFAAAAFLAAGCASNEPTNMGGFSPSAKGNACKKKDNAADCYIVVDADYDPITNKCRSIGVVGSQSDVGFHVDAKDKWVRWLLTDSAIDAGFRFTAKGIAPKSSPPGSPVNVAAWGGNFSNGGADHGGEQYKWKNGNDPAQAGADYLYLVTVEVRGTDGSMVTCTQDPVIRNQR